MAKPHVCPKCGGSKVVDDKPCLVCEGTGVVWEPAKFQGEKEDILRKIRRTTDAQSS